MEHLIFFPMDTGWELALFMAVLSCYFVMDYVKQSKPRASKRTERQIFDEPLEVSSMMARALTTDKFASLDLSYQQKIVALTNNRYYRR